MSPVPPLVSDNPIKYICSVCGVDLDGHMATVKHARVEHNMALVDAIDVAKRSRVLLG